MKSYAKITRAVEEIARAANQKNRKTVDYSALRKNLRGIVNVPKGKLTPQKKGALTKAARRVANNALGGAIPIRVNSRAQSKAVAILTRTQSVSRDKVQFVQGLEGEKAVWTRRGGKPALSMVDKTRGTRRVFMPFDLEALAFDPRSEIARVAGQSTSGVIVGSAGQYLMGQKLQQGGRTFEGEAFDLMVEEFIKYEGELVAADTNERDNTDLQKWAVGLWDVTADKAQKKGTFAPTKAV